MNPKDEELTQINQSLCGALLLIQSHAKIARLNAVRFEDAHDPHWINHPERLVSSVKTNTDCILTIIDQMLAVIEDSVRQPEPPYLPSRIGNNGRDRARKIKHEPKR